MDSNLETPYEEEDEFIECTICDKSIRGETLYKIHLTTPGHIKKEDAIVASGHAVRKQRVPIFEDIVQYLDYMKLDEPIIGLDFLDELPCSDPQSGPKYACRLCNQNANLSETVRHVIGRKHRQRYVEIKRPDLVTWTKQSIITHGGKIIRAKAEIIERQDGRGCPTKLPKKRTEGRLNITRVPPRQKQNWDRNIPKISTQRVLPPLLPELKNYKDKHSQPGRYSSGYPDTPSFHPEDSYMLDRDRPKQRQDTYSHDHMEDKPRRADYRESDSYRGEYMDPDYRMEYEDEYVEDPQRRATPKPGGVPTYESRDEMPRGPVEYYPEEAPPYKRSYPERDPLKEFYSEEVRRGRVRSAERQSSQPVFPEDDEQRWSLDREPGRYDSMNRTSRQGSSEPEANRRSFPTPVESDRSRDLVFGTSKDYCHGMKEPYQVEADDVPGPSRSGPLNSQRRVEVTRAISDIPEPFRRFLKGPTANEDHGKRKRKSRFSDATVEELETTKEMFSDEYGPPNPKFGHCLRPVSAPLRPESQGPQYPDFYSESQSPHHSENYQRGDSESGGVFDILNNIEIENAEEADFLKNKLCNLLKEFKSKKSERAAQNSQGRAAIPKDYDSLSPDPKLSPRHQYDTPLREDFDLRQAEDSYYKEDHRGRGWQQHEHIPDERNTTIPEYHHPVHGEPRQSNRSRYEDVFGQHGMSRMPHITRPDEPDPYPERFQEPKHPRDYQPADKEFLDSHSYSPPLHVERGPRMDRGPQYSSNLDKITSTLLELVKRK
ncbi:uncharacterized protein si:ch211-13c6.2 isoform X1 [Epinephelus fuscoguttatus]|uniref:uncharacterized protein si:ch211-13c6.2 isoform X1 n=2 Tax=Epinephelus fuscoguttatus TaxID=293821 RepID=UPI0020D01EED|nr:uncharacterized protein si:ch211-13c6.2 isoform X1 [Epinephelus fuscoguttatus]